MWDTQYSDFKSTNSPYKKDFIREVVDACHLADIKVGIYYSQRDWYHPDYQPVDPETAERITVPPYFQAKKGKTVKPGKNHQKYIDYQFDVVRELCTNYGKIDIFWFDANYWGGMFTSDMWCSHRPHCVTVLASFFFYIAFQHSIQRIIAVIFLRLKKRKNLF